MRAILAFKRALESATRTGLGRCVVLCLLLGSMMAVTSCRDAEVSKSPLPIVLASVGGHDITPSEFEAERIRRIALGRPVASAEALLKEMVLRHALLQRAERNGVDQDPNVKRQLENLLIAKLKERELPTVTKVIEVSDAELAAEYERRIGEFTRPAKTRLAVLFRETQPGMSGARLGEIRDELNGAREQAIREPAPGGRGPAMMGFGKIAVDHTDDQISRYRGGDIGWLDPGRFDYRFPREVLETGFALEKGVVSEIVETDRGMYIVMKTDGRHAVVTPLESVRESLKRELAKQAGEKARDVYFDESLEMSGVQINSDYLRELDSETVDEIHAKLELPPGVNSPTNEQ